MKNDSRTKNFSHIGPRGQVRMVDVSAKKSTIREASASGAISTLASVLDALFAGELAKGDVLATARLAGIMAAKRTSEWIPLCHSVPLDWVQVEFERTGPETLAIFCTAKTAARTGVEMEAMTAVCAAALTVYDMVKAVDREVVIGPIQLERKSGGRSGTFLRKKSNDNAPPNKRRKR